MSEVINNRYRLLDKIGEGGMGIVYHAQDRLTSQMVALKRVGVLPNHLQFGSHSKVELDPNMWRVGIVTLSQMSQPPNNHLEAVLDTPAYFCVLSGNCVSESVTL